ncbi:CoA transferase [Brevibacterium sp. FAM 25378]|uniref:CoA transferase n=1 Tax=unclassified Brevibacterium TaxID=2614124 RepID=UPI001F10E04F|nr:CoA transferase [Brevibacterium sp. S22]
MSGFLSGMQVVSLAPNLPGPVAANRLQELGAEVTKIEPPAGDLLAVACPPYYEQLAAGQHVLTLDLRSDEGRSELDRLLTEADLLLTSSRITALGRLGVKWDSLHAKHPKLSWIAILGHSGEAADVPGHDLTYQSVAGLVSPPDMPTTLLADLAGGERAAGIGAAAMLAAARAGEGVFSQVAIADVAADFATPLTFGVTRADGPLGGGAPQYGLHEAAEGWVAVAALEPQFWQRMCALLDLDPSGSELTARIRERTADHWEAWGREHDLPVVAVRGQQNVRDVRVPEEV